VAQALLPVRLFRRLVHIPAGIQQAYKLIKREFFALWVAASAET